MKISTLWNKHTHTPYMSIEFCQYRIPNIRISIKAGDRYPILIQTSQSWLKEK